MQRKFLFLLSFLLGICVFLGANFGIKATAQFRIPNIPDSRNIPGLENLLKEKPALSTSLEDAQQAVPFLDNYNPTDTRPLSILPQTQTNGFSVPGGDFELYAQSYCLRAGTHTPGSGQGYLYAPLKGKYDDIIRHVLQRSADHPELPQRDVQMLLWAIIAETKISDMPDERVQVARTLLTDKEIRKLNGGALGQIPDRLKQRALAELPPLARQIFQAKATLRRLAVDSNSTFQQMEEAAVLLGTPELPEDSREVPSGRWSYHGDGYFVRYFPDGYKKTRLQVSVPKPMEIQRDRMGRITSIAHENGNRIEIAYDDTVNSLSFDGDRQVSGYPFRSLRFYRQEAMAPERTIEYEQSWENQGWSLVGLPNGDGSPQSSLSTFTNAGDRYQQATRYQQEQAQAFASLNLESDEKLTNLANLYHLQTAIQQAIGPNAPDWQQDHMQLLFKAWQYQLCQYAGQCRAMARKPSNQLFAASQIFFLAQDSSEGGTNVDPADGAGQPGNTARQRLGQSSRPQPDVPPEKRPKCEKVRRELEGLKRNQQAFANSDLREKARRSGWDGYEYNEAVKDFIKGQRGMGPNDDLEIGAGTNAQNCKVTISPNDRQEWIKNGLPGAIYDAYKAHENVHKDTCEDYNQRPGTSYEDFMSNPDNYGDNEVKAYQASIDKLQNWLDRECR